MLFDQQALKKRVGSKATTFSPLLYLCTADGPWRLPNKLHRDLLERQVALPQFAGTKHKAQLVFPRGTERGARWGSLTIPRAAAARRPTRIVKLIDHAKSTDAAHGCSTLLKGEEAAIGGAATNPTRILGAPSSIIAGQAIFTASPLPISFIAERILCRGDAGP